MPLADVMVRDSYWYAMSKTNLPPSQVYDRNMRILASVLRVDREGGEEGGGFSLFVQLVNKLGTQYSSTEYAIALSRAETYARGAWPMSEVGKAHARWAESKEKS